MRTGRKPVSLHSAKWSERRTQKTRPVNLISIPGEVMEELILETTLNMWRTRTWLGQSVCFYPGEIMLNQYDSLPWQNDWLCSWGGSSERCLPGFQRSVWHRLSQSSVGEPGQTEDVAVRWWALHFSSDDSDMRDKPHSGQPCRFLQVQHACSCLSLVKMYRWWQRICWKLVFYSWEFALLHRVIVLIVKVLVSVEINRRHYFQSNLCICSP